MNLAIPKSTDVPDLALDFARFVTSDRNQLAFAKAASVLPSTQSALKALTAELENAATASTEGDLTTPAAVLRARQVAANQLPEAEVLLPPVADIKVLQQTIYDHLQAAMLGEKDANTAIRDAAQAWNARSQT
jgi:putative chitobiose transport system substrate-binding protein